MSRRRGLAVVVLLMIARPAFGQPRRGSIELGGAVTFVGGYDAGHVAADETRNPSTGSAPLTLFETSSRVSSVAGVAADAGVYLTPRLLVVATFQYSRPTLRTHLSADFEGAADADADTTVSSYALGGAIEYQLRSRGWTPFATGGAGQVREFLEGGDVVTSAEMHVGGGVRRALTHGRHPLDLRGEITATYRTRGAGFDSKHHVVSTAALGIEWRLDCGC